MNESKYPADWDAARVKNLISYYEGLSEEEQVAEDEAEMAEQAGRAVVTIPEEFPPAVRHLLATYKFALASD